jgi:HAD superfamily hydrolase (TIGR01450 family)
MTHPVSLPIQGFLVDLDGTLYLGDHLLPGAEAFLLYTNQTGIPVLFLSNNSSKNRFNYARKLTALGLNVEPEHILTSGEATALYLRTVASPGARIALFGTPELELDFREYGFVQDMDDPAYVVLGFDTTIDYARLTRLCDLVRQGLPYITTHPDLNCPTATGFVPDIGAMMAFVEASTGRKADVVIGKPNRTIVDQAAARLNLPVEGLCMIGDRLYTDIAMGQTAPIYTALVLSGETKRADLLTSPYKPDVIFANLADLTQWLRSGMNAAG